MQNTRKQRINKLSIVPAIQRMTTFFLECHANKDNERYGFLRTLNGRSCTCNEVYSESMRRDDVFHLVSMTVTVKRAAGRTENVAVTVQVSGAD